MRDEAAYLQRTVNSVITQTVRPAAWVIVDDGSSDDTPLIAERAAANHPWIRLHRRPHRGARSVGGGVVEAFDEGLSQSDLNAFDYLCKLDGDLEFGPTYFQRLFEKFEANSRLATASGKCWLVTGRGLQLERTSDEFSLGAAKMYRRQCFQQMGGFVREVMWDGIDCHRCRMLGWEAASYRDEELKICHLRRMGSSQGSIIRGRMRWGYGQYYMGTHPLFALAIGAYRAFERPWLVGGALILIGYIGSLLKGLPQYPDSDFRAFLRQWQMNKLRSAMHDTCHRLTAVRRPTAGPR